MSDDARSTVAYRFLCGADMDPSAARAAYPGGRFVARAAVAAGEDRVWGILLAIDPAQAAPGLAERMATTDDGRTFAALADAQPSGDPRAVLAAARYWELPPDYVRTLAAAAEADAEA